MNAFWPAMFAFLSTVFGIWWQSRKVAAVEVKLDKNTEATETVAAKQVESDVVLADIRTQTNGHTAALVAATKSAALQTGHASGVADERANPTTKAPARHPRTRSRKSDRARKRKATS